MPTHEESPEFWRDWRKLTSNQKDAFKLASREFRQDLRTGRFRASLRVKGYRGSNGVFEMTFAADGRALWEYGNDAQPGDPHVRWLRIGTHDIF